MCLPGYGAGIKSHIVQHDFAGSLWAKLREDRSSDFRLPGVLHPEGLLPYHARQATNLAYHWLAQDL